MAGSLDDIWEGVSVRACVLDACIHLLGELRLAYLAVV